MIRKTLNRWAGYGFIEPPIRLAIQGHGSGAFTFYPADTIEKVNKIVALRGQGFSMQQLRRRWDEEPPVKEKKRPKRKQVRMPATTRANQTLVELARVSKQLDRMEAEQAALRASLEWLLANLTGEAQ